METYRLTHKRDCIIFSVGKFDRYSNRDNSQIDANRLEATFKKLGTDRHEILTPSLPAGRTRDP